MRPMPTAAGAGRRLPTELEWEVAATGHEDGWPSALGRVASDAGLGATSPQMGTLPIWNPDSTVSLNADEGVRVATVPSVAASSSAMSGNGPPATSSPIRASWPIRTKSIHSRGSEITRCCVAAAGRPAPASPGPLTATSSRPTATTCLPVFGPARSRLCWSADLQVRS